MKRTLHLLVALVAGAACASAQDSASTPAAQAPDTSSLILAPKPEASPLAPNADPGSAYKPASSGITKDISAGLPGYSPPLLAPKAADSQADKPKNQIPRLPVEEMARYVVHGKRMPTFRNIDLYTRAGLIQLSLKEHPGLRIGNIFNLNANLAYELAIREALAEDREDVIDTTLAMVAGGDKTEAEAMQQALIDESFEGGTQEGPVGLK
jgi:hypothetical protein